MTPTTTTDLVKRLNRIEGQVAGLRRALERGDADCTELLLQVKASTNALKRFGETFARTYARQCVADKKNGRALASDLDAIIHSAFTLS